MNLFLIKSNKHDHHASSEIGKALWWCPDSKGYTYNLEEAGLYEENEAKLICDVTGISDENMAYPALPLIARERGRTAVKFGKLEDMLERLEGN